MKRKLREELIRLSTDIITSRESDGIANLYEQAKNLYEKLAVLKFIDEKLKDVEVDVSKNVIASKFENMANAVMNANASVPESNPHEEDIITPGIDTITAMISEMPQNEKTTQIFEDFMTQPNIMKNDKELFMPANGQESNEPIKPKSLNEKLQKEVKIDLNDRLAFVKHLFGDSSEDFNRVISQLNTIDTHERCVAFIDNMVKPDYNQWEGKEAYEARFMALIERRFS